MSIHNMKFFIYLTVTFMQIMSGREYKIKLYCEKITHSHSEVRHSIILESLKISITKWRGKLWSENTYQI